MEKRTKRANVDISGRVEELVKIIHDKYPNVSKSKIVNALANKGAEFLKENPDKIADTLLSV